MVSDISILIPVFNQDVTALVHTLLAQCRRLPIDFEIRIYDDGSSPGVKEINRSLANLKQVLYLELPQNIGRAAIRNRLSREATCQHLLFLDNDCIPVSSNFIFNYICAAADADLVFGGISYVAKAPEKSYRLHWKYGVKRGAKSAEERQSNPYDDIFLCNTLVKKELMLQYPLNENLLQYGHEDTLFAVNMRRNKIKVAHTHNPVVHLGLETTPVLLAKTEQALANLVALYNSGEIQDEVRLIRAFEMMATLHLQVPFISLLSRLEVLLHTNLRSSSPNLHIFDLYRLFLLSKKLNKVTVQR